MRFPFLGSLRPNLQSNPTWGPTTTFTKTPAPIAGAGITLCTSGSPAEAGASRSTLTRMTGFSLWKTGSSLSPKKITPSRTNTGNRSLRKTCFPSSRNDLGAVIGWKLLWGMNLGMNSTEGIIPFPDQMGCFGTKWEAWGCVLLMGREPMTSCGESFHEDFPSPTFLSRVPSCSHCAAGGYQRLPGEYPLGSLS